MSIIISLLLHESKVKLRMDVNSKEIIRMYLGCDLLISQGTVPINACFMQWILVVYNHLSMLPSYSASYYKAMEDSATSEAIASPLFVS